jgi:Rod binding domain-containing protein
MEISPFLSSSVSSGNIDSDLAKRNQEHQQRMSELQSFARAEFNLETMSEKEIKDLKDTAAGIEQIFVKMLVDQMRKSIQRPQTESAAQNQGHDIFEEMLYDEYGKKISQQGGFGIADIIFRQKTTPTIAPRDLERLYQNSQNTQRTPPT